MNFIYLGVEDLDNFHGKPMGGKMEEAVAALQAAISNNGPHGLTPEAPSKDVAATNLSGKQGGETVKQ